MTKNWEREKSRMHELYMVRGMKLAHLQKIMSEQYGFQASERAYKQKFKEWRWFKKTPRSSTITSAGPARSPSSSPGDHESDPYGSDVPSRTGSPYQVHGPYSRTRDASASFDHSYDPYPVTLGFEQPYPCPPVTSDPGLDHIGGYGIIPNTQVPGMSVGPMSPQAPPPPGRDYPVPGSHPQVSLPPMSHLQTSAFKDALHEAERRAEMGHFDLAERALESAMRSLHWMKNCS